MATNKIHFITTLLVPFVHEDVNPTYFNTDAATQVITNDSIRCWAGPREYSHFTINPATGEVSWATFPNTDIKNWTEEMVKSMPCYSAGKPGNAVIDEATIPSVFWDHNEKSLQNERLFLHLIQDKSYDRFIKTVIDTTHRYEDKYVFNGKVLTGAQLRGEGMERWTKGILSELDDQFFVRVSKKYFEFIGVKTDNVWIENIMKLAILNNYSPELAMKTIKFVSLSDKANEIIRSGNFDAEVWPVKNCVVDTAIDWMLEDIYDAYKALKHITG